MIRRRRGAVMAGWPTATLLAVAVVGVATVVVISTGGGTFALLDARSSTEPATITSGSADLSLSSLALPTAPLWPGATEFGVVTATNTGDVPLDLDIAMGRVPVATATASAVRSDLRVTAGPAASASVCRSGGVRPTWSGTLDSTEPRSAGVALRPGAAVVLCLAVAMPADAAASQQGLSTDFTTTISGTQARS
ncbi:hypothetical protein [Curtobacterium aurantiacum]|uniref:Uncharacterized protein n=1 Tax=Curtobacterium aurantiacum TaxID=3236919 RepID=A0ABS5VGV4_9MICO|nr:hypothetical protein [Curtobacterium flaccumfaciens]MBT1546581.1 hypothetical protein [Curtobacterium flaccumfaciens pv. flaccumfaciens]MBT1588141.1 hypothetical protein [Curtobacterium flaccumfaciens pv. flaccumfaciens]